MLIKLVLRNFEYEGVNRVFVSIDSNFQVQDLKAYIQDNLGIQRDFQIFVHDYILTNDSYLRDYLSLAEDGYNLKAHVVVKPESQDKVIKQNDGQITKLKNEVERLNQILEELSQLKTSNPRQAASTKNQKPNQYQINESASESSSEQSIAPTKVTNKNVIEVKHKLFKQPVQTRQVQKEKQSQPQVQQVKPSVISQSTKVQDKGNTNKTKSIVQKITIEASSSSESLDLQIFDKAKQKAAPFVPQLSKSLSIHPSNNPPSNGERKLTFIKLNGEQIKEDSNTLLKGDRIKFKHIFLDLETVQPTVSNYCYGKIINNYHDQSKVQIHKEQTNDSIILSYNELVEVWKEGLNDRDDENNQDDQNQSTQPLKQYLPRPATQRQSRFLNVHMDMLYSVGRQINYYYCDKAYAKDDYIKQHVDDENCMPLVHLLNFPKIKKVLNSEQKLVELLQLYLEQEGANANYEIFKKDETWVVKKK